MIPTRIDGCTRVLGAPVGWTPETSGPCVGLPIRDEMNGDVPCMVLSPDQVRDILVSEARKCEDKPWRSTGVGKWCAKHGVRKGHVSEFLNGKRLPTSDILAALGLEWRIVRRAHATEEQPHA